MPAFGSNSFVIVASRVAGLSAPLEFSSHAAVSVNEAPAPANCWYRTFSSTVTVSSAAALVPANATGACCCSPRMTVRPPGSPVVVSHTLTVSPAAAADRSGSAAIAAPSSSTAAKTPLDTRDTNLIYVLY